MTGQEQHAGQPTEATGLHELDAEELSQRISQALQPTFAEINNRVAEAVADTLAGARSTSAQSEDQRPRETLHENHDAEPTDTEDAEEGSLLEKAQSSMVSSFLGAMREEGGDQLEQLADHGVDLLFSRRARGWMRNLADQTLQATLYDALNSIDDPSERYQLYRGTLSKLRPIVRGAVDAMYTEDARSTLKRQARGAIPSLLHGDFDTAFSMLVDALSDVTDNAEDALSNNSREVLQVFQQISTTLIEEQVEDAAEDKIDPETIQRHMQDKVEEARGKLADKVGSLQEGVQAAQSQLKERTGGTSGRGRQGAPPSGLPPSGFPPSGQPPSGMPPSGKPPFGRPPSGLPPAVEHRRNSRRSQRRHSANRSRT